MILQSQSPPLVSVTQQSVTGTGDNSGVALLGGVPSAPVIQYLSRGISTVSELSLPAPELSRTLSTRSYASISSYESPEQRSLDIAAFQPQAPPCPILLRTKTPNAAVPDFTLPSPCSTPTCKQWRTSLGQQIFFSNPLIGVSQAAPTMTMQPVQPILQPLSAPLRTVSELDLPTACISRTASLCSNLSRTVSQGNVLSAPILVQIESAAKVPKRW